MEVSIEGFDLIRFEGVNQLFLIWFELSIQEPFCVVILNVKLKLLERNYYGEHFLLDGNVCANDQFECENGKCIPASWRCDGDDDCSDTSDETSAYCNTKVRSIRYTF